MTIADITKEQLEEYVKLSSNWIEFMIKCGYTNTNNRINIKRKLDLFNINTDHFNNNTVQLKRYTNDIIFIKNSSYKSSTGIKQRLIKYYNWEYKCSQCKLSEWLGKPISIELDHINGDHYDNRIENLRFLCPNCHAQTDTYRGKNVKFNKTIDTTCPDCNGTKRKLHKKCKKCNMNNKLLNNGSSYTKTYKYSHNKLCIDCNKVIYNESLRCISCYKKSKKIGNHVKEKIENKSTKKCSDCNKIISIKSIRCRLCHYNVLKEKRNTYNKQSVKGYCIDCNKNIDHKAIRCVLCSTNIIKNINNKISNTCVDCNKNIWNTSYRCIDCSKFKLRKVERPSYEQLLEDKKHMDMVKIGKKYNVSDNTIRKWIKYYEKEFKS
jgi:hypothetical protein